MTAQSINPVGDGRRLPYGRPNILVIVTDDQSIRTMQRDVMPNVLRYMEKGGRTYTNFFVTNPVCCPSRASLMTGRYDHNNGVTGNTAEAFHLDFASTLQHQIRNAGYQTWISGKFLNGFSVVHDGRPPDWDRYATTPGGRHYASAFHIGGSDGPGRRFIYRPFADRLIEREAMSFLGWTERSDSRPWLGLIGLTVPHGPPTPMKGYRHLALNVRRPTAAERTGSPAGEWPGYRAHAIPGKPHFDAAGWIAQLRMLRQADDIIGRVFERLRSQDELRNTLVVFTSDNGVLFGAHRLTGKRLPYTESIKVPAMVRWPGHITPGSVDRRMTANIDLAPTLLHAAGVTPDPRFPIDGRDLLDRSWHRPYLLTEHRKEHDHGLNTWAPTWASLRTPAWQYIEYFRGRRTVYREYYDLRSDPAELHNTLVEGPAEPRPRTARLHRLLEAARRCSGAGCP